MLIQTISVWLRASLILGAIVILAVVSTNKALAQGSPDAGSTSLFGATLFAPDSLDAAEPPAAPIDYSAPSVPSFDLSPRKAVVNDGEIPSVDSSPAKRNFRPEEALGRIQSKDGTFGLETERRADPGKLVPMNDFSEAQSKKPDSFIGLSIVRPYDPK